MGMAKVGGKAYRLPSGAEPSRDIFLPVLYAEPEPVVEEYAPLTREVRREQKRRTEPVVHERLLESFD